MEPDAELAVPAHLILTYDGGQFYCKLCKAFLRANEDEAARHVKLKKHIALRMEHSASLDIELTGERILLDRLATAHRDAFSELLRLHYEALDTYIAHVEEHPCTGAPTHVASPPAAKTKRRDVADRALSHLPSSLVMSLCAQVCDRDGSIASPALMDVALQQLYQLSLDLDEKVQLVFLVYDSLKSRLHEMRAVYDAHFPMFLDWMRALTAQPPRHAHEVDALFALLRLVADFPPREASLRHAVADALRLMEATTDDDAS
ncbi:Aste57867_9652 [Aphanomyces stellatus]|uniref:Aste57867_9652 protein n=1 Tax=Aphanomyces stellatus TaxID=120398 RepID=A0A485KNX5_9STRA|nr:hypothetical protein As57867_009614 [Aphanomyces stellatus]VFT86531.1 Aste57867_9652 [Aphanomyces stellatus]